MNKKKRKQPNDTAGSHRKIMAGVCRIAVTLGVLVLLWFGISRLLLLIMGKINEPQISNSRIVPQITRPIMISEPELIPQDTRIATPWGTVERVISYSPFDMETAVKQEISQWLARGAKKVPNPDKNNGCLPETLYQMPDGRLIFIHSENDSKPPGGKTAVSTYIFNNLSSNDDLFKDSEFYDNTLSAMQPDSLDILPTDLKPLAMGKIKHVVNRGSGEHKSYYIQSELKGHINTVATKFILNAKKTAWNELPQLDEALREIQKAKIGDELKLSENKIIVLAKSSWSAVAVLSAKSGYVTQINLKIRKYKL